MLNVWRCDIEGGLANSQNCKLGADVAQARDERLYAETMAMTFTYCIIYALIMHGVALCSVPLLCFILRVEKQQRPAPPLLLSSFVCQPELKGLFKN